MITMHPTIDSKLRMDKFFLSMTDSWVDAGFSRLLFDAGLSLFTDEVKGIFGDEGHPAWRQLSESTVQERTLLGGMGATFGPRHPILKRTGALLRGLTDPEFSERTVTMEAAAEGQIIEESVRVGNRTDKERTPLGDKRMFGTSDERFLSLQDGTSKWPARHMLPEGMDRQLLYVKIEKKAVDMLRKMIHDRLV